MQKLIIWLVYLTWTTLSLADPKIIPPYPHSDIADNADYLSERYKKEPKFRVRQDEQTLTVLADHVEDEWWSLTDSNR